MKDVARLIRRHLDGIVAWTQTRKTNGFIEAINGLFQSAKRKAAATRASKPCEPCYSSSRASSTSPLQPTCLVSRITHCIFKRA
jgi:Transposase